MLDTFIHKGKRKRLVELLEKKGISDEAVLEAIGAIPRHGFVEGAFSAEAYEDKALPIHAGQTISQPFTVAFQTQLLQIKKGQKVLEIGTGSAYQAAILAKMGAKVYSIEREARLHREAAVRLEDLGLEVMLKYGDGTQGWLENAPYQGIIVTAASPSVPDSLMKQMAIGGRMVIPVGSLEKQRMYLVKRVNRAEWTKEILQSFKFVPLIGRFGFPDQD
ncbi:MAG: protein-L-isoaspartate(D-aspartate) O-methyltransferase [Bacteroidia bacterium]|nr:protein-L-isoaspartate(D-aspartate) O-methyltransferase [Bacteroidia bacterium]